MKKAIILIFVFVMILVTVFLLMKPNKEVIEVRQKRPFNLREPQTKTIRIDGKDYILTVTKYDPPYSHTELLRSREEADCSTPEGTDLALISAWGRDKDWCLSLLDREMREHILDLDKESGGQLFDEHLKEKSLPDDLTKTDHYYKYIYKVEFEINDKIYAIIRFKEVIEGEESMGYRTFVKQGRIWLATDIDHPVEQLVARRSYEEIVEILNKGAWSIE